MALDLLDHIFDILAFTETSIKSKDDVMNFPGYKSEGVHRSDRRVGGTSLCFRDSHGYILCPEFSNVYIDHFESIDVKCLESLIDFVYRLPTDEINEYLNYVSELLAYVSCVNLPVVLMGDFNIDVLSSGSSCRSFRDVIESFGCSSVITAPTR